MPGLAVLLCLCLVLALAAGAQARTRSQDSAAKFVCGERWITFEPVGLTEPPLKDVEPIKDQVWTIRKTELLRAFAGFDNGLACLSTEFRGKLALIYVMPETYWKIVKCLG